MRIPFDGSGMATFSLRINKEERVFSVDLATGMDEVAEGFLLVYPNPADERVFVDAGGQEVPDGTRIRMTDQQGRRILEAPFKGQLREIDLSDRPAGGLLYLQIISPTGEVVAGQKVLLTGDFP